VRLGREVDDRLAASGGVGDRIRVGDVALAELVLDAVEVRAVAGVRQLVEHDDVVVAGREPPHEVRADEPGPAGDEHAHGNTLPAAGRPSYAQDEVRELPRGTVTFLFTDVEGSTKLLRERGDEYAALLAEYRRLLREAVRRHGGVEVDTQGDAFFVAFAEPRGAIAAAQEAQAALAATPVRVRMGIHTGEPIVTAEGYVGEDVHLGARIAAAGHGGQVLLSQATRMLVGGDALDLGEHRLKDFAEAVAIHQLGDERFPPLKTISNTNLPRPASSFVGRERELAELTALLRHGARLVTLSGPGGSGKTRLAIEAAAELLPQFKAGVFWVGLATLRDPGLVVDTIAQAVGAKDGLAEHVGERELLLLLDNLEQVVGAAPELASLVEACPNLSLLVTSRALLRVRGEVEYPVPPLAEVEAVELFGARSRLEPDATVAELCRRLDNLPLAVELAAARTSVLSLAQILERLAQRLDLLKGGRDAEARQETLRATIQWSYELLGADEQRLFARLAVFRGGCTLEAAVEVCEADLETLQSLVDNSLVRHTGERFWLLETIREYAADQLEPTEMDGMRDRLADYVVALGEESVPHIREAAAEWLDLLERELDNIRATLDWLERSGDDERELALAGALGDFWALRGHHLEGRDRVERALAAAPARTPARARALTVAAGLAGDLGDEEAARARAEQALALHRELGDEWGAALALFMLGISAIYSDPARARDCFTESAALFRELGDRWQALDVTRRLAWSYERLGDRDRAREIHEANLEEARAAGNRYTEATTLSVLSRYHIRAGRLDEAVAQVKEATRLHREIGELWYLAYDLSTFARILALRQGAATAARLLAAVETLQEQFGMSEPWLTEMNEETLSSIQKQLDEHEIAHAWAEGRKLTPDEAVALALQALD
jgi:predicted ATPase/class 3 adenylate cyclase